MGEMYLYSAYGLSIRSDLPLPELTASAGASSDVTLRLGSLSRGWPRPQERDASICLHAQVYLWWRHLGAVLIREGREVIVDPLPDVDPGLLRLYLLGSAFSILLHQRGYFTLHSSSVTLSTGAVAFVGMKGRGKSTTAAALWRRGHPLLADDLVAIRTCSEEGAVVVPGFPAFRLTPESLAASLAEDPAEWPCVAAQSEKRLRSAGERFAGRSAPLKRIYVVEKGDELRIERLTSQAALLELLRHTYVFRLLGAMKAEAWHLRECSRILRHTSIYRLVRSDDISDLPRLLDLIEGAEAPMA